MASNFWRKGNITQKIFGVLLVIALPLFVWAVLTQRLDLRKRAASIVPTYSGRIQWTDTNANTVTLFADNFYIFTNSQYFFGEGATYSVHSDPGDATYTTLEVTWNESSVEMRMYMYFHNDGSKWWADEIRTYNGRSPGDWVFYTGPFFNLPLGQAYKGTIDFASDATSPFAGRLHFSNLTLLPFANRYPSLTYQDSCNVSCVQNSDCGTGYCYQPPMPYCPPDRACIQVMPTKICRSLDNPTDVTCSKKLPTPGSCNAKCVQNSDCTTTGYCFQPPMPVCPPGRLCPQVMTAARICRSLDNPTDVTCSPRPGCKYQQVECFQAPCDPILVCPPSSTPTTTPTPTPTPASMTLNIRFKFAGVADQSAQGAQVSVRFINGPVDLTTGPLTANYTSDGIYTLLFTTPNGLLAGTRYQVILKGEKHVAVKFCKQVGQTSPCQTGDAITVPNPAPLTWGFDFTGYPLPPGDVYPQDGVANGADYAKLKDLMSKSCSQLTDQDKLVGDLNYDGCVNIKDVFLMRQTLETRYDEN